MKNYFGAKTNNILINKLSTINLTALSVFLIYFFSITLAPIINGVISVRHNILFISAQNKNFNLRAQILKLKTNGANIITAATYINNGQMLARQIDNNNLQSYISDAKGSVLKLNNFDGSNSQNYSYDAYGNIIKDCPSSQKTSASTNPAIAQGINAQRGNFSAATINPFQYNGERTDANTALQYLRARFYNPEIKRFINQDTYSLLNKFGYVDGNPVMKTDPSGHNSVGDWQMFAFIMIGVIGAGFLLVKVTLSAGKRVKSLQISQSSLGSGRFGNGTKEVAGATNNSANEVCDLMEKQSARGEAFRGKIKEEEEEPPRSKIKGEEKALRGKIKEEEEAFRGKIKEMKEKEEQYILLQQDLEERQSWLLESNRKKYDSVYGSYKYLQREVIRLSDVRKKLEAAMAEIDRLREQLAFLKKEKAERL